MTDDEWEELQKKLDELASRLREAIEPLVQSMEIVFDKYVVDAERTPEEIKRDIKHERNPMRLKQLQKELNSSYVYWRKRNGGKDGTTKSRRSD